MKSKLILVESPASAPAPAPTPRRKGRPRSVSISESDTMNEINKEEIKILTIDPPVEITPKIRGRPKKVIV